MRPVRIFVSHSSEDSAVLAAIHHTVQKKLPNARVVNVDRHLLPGKPIDAGLIRLIDTSHVFVHVSSPAAANSHWVAQEVEFARAKEKLDETHYITVIAKTNGTLQGEFNDKELLRYDQNPQRALDDLVEAIAKIAPTSLLPEADLRIIGYKRTVSALLLALVATMLLVGANIGIDTPTGVGWLHILQALIIAYLAVDIYMIKSKTSDPRSKRVLSMWLGVWISWMRQRVNAAVPVVTRQTRYGGRDCVRVIQVRNHPLTGE
jgi:TIR domain